MTMLSRLDIRPIPVNYSAFSGIPKKGPYLSRLVQPVVDPRLTGDSSFVSGRLGSADSRALIREPQSKTSRIVRANTS